MKKGFSLVELVISLIVIICITGAFAPLITKKLAHNGIGLAGGSSQEFSAECSDKFGEYCTLCTDSYCIDCTSLVCADDEYRDTPSCTCKKCTDKYGADCTVCNEEKCLTCPDGQFLDENNKCVNCSTKFANCTSCTSSQCSACDSGYTLTNPASSTPCTKFECGGDDFIQIGDLCITKKNMGDGDKLTIPSGVNVVNVGTYCSTLSSNKCCWKGNTSGSKCDNGNGGGYSGCNRTVCNWSAADYICKNFSAGGYTWRLATKDEMPNWANNSKGKGVNGLQLCDRYSGYSSAQCDSTYSCPGSFNENCYPSYVWSGTVSGSSYAYNYYLISGGWGQSSNIRTNAFSVRCVSEMSQSCADKFNEGCAVCDSSQCLECSSGYVLKNGKCSIDCASKFGSNCSECNMTKCTKCADGYHMGTATANPACESDFTCSGADFMQIGNLCITRRNMGDSTALAIPSGVNVVNVGSRCLPSASNFCCWKGATASHCDSLNSEYSGCDRTLCDLYAAAYICKNFKAGGYTWRLPTKSEASNWGLYSIGKGSNGLQLCDEYSSYSSPKCDDLYGRCEGSYGTCGPCRIWLTSNSYELSKGYWDDTPSFNEYAHSVRCVTNL